MRSIPLNFLEIEDSIHSEIEAAGMIVLGWFRLDNCRVGMLIGNVGSAIWRPFTSSSFLQDEKPHPLNRWTQSVLDPLADKTDGEMVFPFGETVWPFQQWAMKAMGVQRSPLGLLIHPKYGLWFALRGALIVKDQEWQPDAMELLHPCDVCWDKPCLSACPVEAFTKNGFAVSACREHLQIQAGLECMEQGCLARAACPVGTAYQYRSHHQTFHMAALV